NFDQRLTTQFSRESVRTHIAGWRERQREIQALDDGRKFLCRRTVKNVGTVEIHLPDLDRRAALASAAQRAPACKLARWFPYEFEAWVGHGEPLNDESCT